MSKIGPKLKFFSGGQKMTSTVLPKVRSMSEGSQIPEESFSKKSGKTDFGSKTENSDRSGPVEHVQNWAKTQVFFKGPKMTSTGLPKIRSVSEGSQIPEESFSKKSGKTDFGSKTENSDRSGPVEHV